LPRTSKTSPRSRPAMRRKKPWNHSSSSSSSGQQRSERCAPNAAKWCLNPGGRTRCTRRHQALYERGTSNVPPETITPLLPREQDGVRGGDTRNGPVRMHGSGASSDSVSIDVWPGNRSTACRYSHSCQQRPAACRDCLYRWRAGKRRGVFEGRADPHERARGAGKPRCGGGFRRRSPGGRTVGQRIQSRTLPWWRPSGQACLPPNYSLPCPASVNLPS